MKKIIFAGITFWVAVAAVSILPTRVPAAGFDTFARTIEYRLYARPTLIASLNAVRHKALTGTDISYQYRWDRDVVTYSITNCPTSLECEMAHDAVREAFEAWDTVIALSLVEVPEGGDITVSWEQGAHGDSSVNIFDGAGGMVAHAAYPYRGGRRRIDGDIHLDDSETWITSPVDGEPAGEVMLTPVLLHELGHALGLEHSDNPEAIMWHTHTSRMELTAEDIERGQELYGSGLDYALK